jgi:electron transfer flavoprotein beta subunit
MSKIVTCFKWVVDEADLKAEGSSREIRTDRAERKISDYDKNALEAGVQINESTEGSFTALTVGVPAAKTAFKDALSRGADDGVFVADASLTDLDPAVTAKLLAAALRLTGPYDLILFGEGSNDLYAQQVGPRTAELLQLPVITYANSIKLKDGRVVAERSLEDSTEVVSCELPAIVAVTPDINVPRIPGLKQIMGAGKKPVRELSLSDLGFTATDIQNPAAETRMEGAVMERKNICFQGDLQQAVEEAVRTVIREGCVS